MERKIERQKIPSSSPCNCKHKSWASFPSQLLHFQILHIVFTFFKETMVQFLSAFSHFHTVHRLTDI